MKTFRRILTLSCVALLGVGCASQAHKPLVDNGAVKKRMSKIRTTAYTHTEAGGSRNAMGKRLCGQNVKSAAADWSHFPLGTKFRIIDTNEVFQIDDYGTALIGTDTIDLYKTSRLEMRKWGVRNVDIDILQWGSNEESLHVLAPRAHNHICRRMIVALQGKARSQSTLRTF